MLRVAIQRCQRVPVGTPFAGSLVDVVSKEFGLGADSDTVANSFDPHLFEHALIHFYEVLAIDIVLPKHVHILPTFDAAEPFTHSNLIPILHRITWII